MLSSLDGLKPALYLVVVSWKMGLTNCDQVCGMPLGLL
jgi:hypothetical protein